MNFLEKLSRAVTGAVESMGEATRRTAALNRMRTVIDAQEQAAQREYLALGRYYYNNLRDRKDPVAESHSAELDVILGRQDRALASLEELYQYEGPTDAFFAQGEEREEVDLEDVKKFDFDPEKAAETVKSTMDKAVETVTPVVEAVKEKAAPVVEAVKEKAAPVVEAAKEKAAPVVEAVKEKAAPVVDAVKEKAEEVKKAVKEAREKGAQEAQAAKETMEEAKKEAQEAEAAVEKAAREVEETLKNAQNAAPTEDEEPVTGKIQPEKKEPVDENADLPFEG